MVSKYYRQKNKNLTDKGTTKVIGGTKQSMQVYNHYNLFQKGPSIRTNHRKKYLNSLPVCR